MKVDDLFGADLMLGPSSVDLYWSICRRHLSTVNSFI